MAGLSLCFMLAIIAMIIERIAIWPFTLSNGDHPIEAVIIAIILGIIINSIIHIPQYFTKGIQFSSKNILYLAIILLGSNLDLRMVSQLSMHVIVIITICVITAFVFTLLLSKMFHIGRKMAILMAFGTAICGSAAIAVAAPIVQADKEDVAVSITAINLIGLLGIFVFPLLGHLFGLSQTTLGIWAGVSLQAVAQAVAASFAYGHTAGLVGTLVKLVRVLFLIPAIFLVNYWQKKQLQSQTFSQNKIHLFDYVPLFVILFFVMMLCKTFGFFADFSLYNTTISPQYILTSLSQFFMTTAFAAIGLSTSFKNLYKLGKVPIIVAIIAIVFMAAIGLIFTLWFGV